MQKKAKLALFDQSPDSQNQKMVANWLLPSSKPKEAPPFAEDDTTYPYQAIEQAILYWSAYECKRLQAFGFTLSIACLQKLMERLAIYFCHKAGAKQQIKSKDFCEIFKEIVGDTLQEKDLIMAFPKGQAQQLFACDADGYFMFSNPAVWEVILARLLFDGYEPVLHQEASIRKFPNVANYYSQMCWAEIVPSNFFEWTATRKMQYQLHKEEDIFSLFNHKDTFDLGDCKHKDGIAALINSFSDPAARAFFLGMSKAGLQKLPWQEGQFACFAYMLQDWMQQNALPNTQEEKLIFSFAQQFHAAWDINKTTSYFQKALGGTTQLNPPDYLKKTHALFVRRDEERTLPKHKCVLDYYLLESETLESIHFCSTYPGCTAFVIEEMAKRRRENLASDALHITARSNMALLYFHPKPERVKKLKASGLALKDIQRILPFEKLEELDISQNELEDVSALNRIQTLQKLYLNANKIQSVSGLLGLLETAPDSLGRRNSGLQLRNLQVLHLKDNPALLLEENTKKMLAWHPGLRYLELEEDTWPKDKRTGMLAALRNEILQKPALEEVAAGQFTMGRTENYQVPASYSARGRALANIYLNWELPTRIVTMDSFQMSKFPVTLAGFRRFINATRYKTTAERTGESLIVNYKAGTWKSKKDICWQHDHRGYLATEELWPVLHVSWYDAVAYCNWLSEEQGLMPCYDISELALEQAEEPKVVLRSTRGGYRLPSEAEWQYAAKGGHLQHSFLYAGSDDVDQVAWYGDNSGNEIIKENSSSLGHAWSDLSRSQPRPHAVGQLLSNGLGLYDMSGNVIEWFEDDWYDSYKNAPLDGRARIDEPRRDSRALSGSSCVGVTFNCRVVHRRHAAPNYHRGTLGFRLVFVP